MNQISLSDGRMSSVGDWPATFRDLDPSGLLIVGVLRHWHAGLRYGRPLHFEVVARELRGALSRKDGEAAFTAVAGCFRVMVRSARGGLQVHLPCCPGLGNDEIRLMVMVGCCQADRFLAARLIAEDLVEPSSVGDLLGYVSTLGALMADHGLRMEMPGESTGEPTGESRKESRGEQGGKSKRAFNEIGRLH